MLSTTLLSRRTCVTFDTTSESRAGESTAKMRVKRKIIGSISLSNCPP